MFRTITLDETDLLERFKNTPIDEISLDKFWVPLREFAESHEIKFIASNGEIKWLKDFRV